MDKQKLAKELVKLSTSADGVVERVRVQAVCQYIECNVEKNKQVPLLKEYLKRLAPELNKQRAEIEYSGELSQEVLGELEQKIYARLGKKVEVQKTLNKSLIGGVRVRVADDVFQRSVSADIENLIRSCKKP